MRFTRRLARRIFEDNDEELELVEEEDAPAVTTNGLAAETAACSTADIIVAGVPLIRFVHKSEVMIVRSQRIKIAKIEI